MLNSAQRYSLSLESLYLCIRNESVERFEQLATTEKNAKTRLIDAHFSALPPAALTPPSTLFFSFLIFNF